MLDSMRSKLSTWLEQKHEQQRRKKYDAANRRNIENLALGADKMRRVPMVWR